MQIVFIPSDFDVYVGARIIFSSDAVITEAPNRKVSFLTMTRISSLTLQNLLIFVANWRLGFELWTQFMLAS